MFVLSKTPGQQFHGEAIDRLAILCMRFCIMYFDSPDVTLMPSYNFGFQQGVYVLNIWVVDFCNLEPF